MKKIVTLGMLFFAAMSYSQKVGNSELHVGYSDATFLDFATSFNSFLGDAITSGITGAKIKDAKTKRLGMFEIGYRYTISNRFKIGGDVNYFKIDRTFDIKNTRNIRRTTYVLVMPSAEFSYLKTSHLNFYGSVSAGYASINTKEKEVNAARYSQDDGTFAFQINPIGLNWSVLDNKKLGLFLEAGFGYKGIVLAGISYKL